MQRKRITYLIFRLANKIRTTPAGKTRVKYCNYNWYEQKRKIQLNYSQSILNYAYFITIDCAPAHIISMFV